MDSSTKRRFGISLFCLLMLFVWVQHPILRANPNYEQIVAPMRDKLKTESPDVRAAASVVAQTAEQTIFHVEGNHYKAQINTDSKAHAAMLSDPIAYSYVWGTGGDGELYSDGSWWDTSSNYAGLVHYSNIDLDSFFSFPIPAVLADTNVVKSVDTIKVVINVYSEANEGSEVTRVKALDTTNKCGAGGDDPGDGADEIARDGPWTIPRKSGQADTTGLNSVGWKEVELPSAWLSPGDTGYLTLYFLPYSGWEEGSDSINFYTKDSGSGPYIEVHYTLWTAPIANAADITDEPSQLKPGQNYEVQTIISDNDGRTNLNKGYLYISEDHVSNRVRFDWDRATDTFSQGEGASYVILNTTDCSSAEYGANAYQLTWNFTVTRDWEEGVMDWANQATDAQSKDTGINWNDEDTWYTDRLWVHSISVYWIAEETYLEDKNRVTTDQSLNITGYVYWFSTTTKYNLELGVPSAKLFVDGEDQGTTYNCSLDSNGFFQINYTTPLIADWDWSLDIQLGSIPTGMSEGPSNDDGKSPLYLLYTTQMVVVATIQPATIVPNKLVAYGINAGDLFFEIGEYGFRAMEANDGEYYGVRGVSCIEVYMVLEFGSNYWMVVDKLTYDVTRDGGSSTTVKVFDFHPSQTEIASGGTTVTGTHAITNTNWNDGRMQVKCRLTSTDDHIFILADQLTVNFTAITEIYKLTAFIEGTVELQQVIIPVLAAQANVTLSDISKDFSIRSIHPDVPYIDSISTDGTVKLYNTAKTNYEVTFETGRTRHILHFAATSQDGVGLEWERFKWYANETRIPYPPEYELYAGNYTLTVKDFYEETVATGNFTIPSTDPRHTYLEVSILYYLYTLGNWDRKGYTANVTRNARTTSYSLAGYPCSISFYLFGTVAGVNYTVEYFDKNGKSMGNETITMENDAQSDTIDYIIGDELPDVKVGPGGGGTVIMGLPLDTFLFFVIPVTGLFILTGYMAWKQRGPKTPKPVQEPVTAQEKSKALREEAENRKKTVRK